MPTDIHHSTSIGAKDDTQLVTFMLKNEEFGFDIMSVQEIIRPPKMAKVPRTPSYVEGIANLRGAVLPIIDMRPRFGMEHAEETDGTRVLVLDVSGTKIGLRVDRVKQVTSVDRAQVEPPPRAITSSQTNYLDGVVKLDSGARIIMALNADKVCELDLDGGAHENRRQSEQQVTRSAEMVSGENEDLQQMVSFRIAKEEFAFPMERVREILRVETPTQVPEVPDYVLGVLTVRGDLLPIIDLRKQLKMQSLAEECRERCAAVTKAYDTWLHSARQSVDRQHWMLEAGASEELRKWATEFSSSSQVLMDALGRVRAVDDQVVRLLRQAQQAARVNNVPVAESSIRDAVMSGERVVASLMEFQQQIASNIKEDQRIIVVDAGGALLGLVVDHVNEVLNVPKKAIDAPPSIASNAEQDLSGIAKLEQGKRLLLLLDPSRMLKDASLDRIQQTIGEELASAHEVKPNAGEDKVHDNSDVQLVTFQLGQEEYGIAISQIQEIDRLSTITRVPKVADYVEGVTNLRGEVIPVVDTRKRLDLNVPPADDHTRIIIVELGGVKTGLVVDSVREVLSLPRKDVCEPPETIQTGVAQQFVSAIGKVDNGKRIIFLLNIEQILPSDKRAQLQA